MYRILVIDDEKIVLDSVRYIIESNYNNVDIETARNGKEGLIKFDSFKPHIVITDIRMPGISGLEFIKKAYKIDKKVKFLIVTAFEQFEYAKESFKFSVEDYILKPLNKKTLIESLDKTIKKIELENKRRNEELESIEKYFSSINLVESNFFNSVILRRDFTKYLDQYRDLLSVDLTNGYIVAIKFRHISEDAFWNQENANNHKLNDGNEYLKTHVKYNYDALVSNVFFNKIFIYLENNENVSEESILEFWKNVYDKLIKKFGLKIKVGIGKPKKISSIYDSYEEAIIVLKLSDEKVDRYTSSIMSSIDLKIFTQICDQLLMHFKNRSKKVFDSFSDLKNLYLSNIGKDAKDQSTEYNLLELLIQLYRESQSVKEYESDIIYGKKYIYDYLGKTSLEKLNYFEEKLNELFWDYVNAKDIKYSDIVVEVIKIIDTSYREEITLEETAKKVNVTPQYLSKLFKSETGKSFKETITEIRVNEAKKLFKSTKSSISEIAYMVGYNDPNYFIRLFKKNTGLTPKEYKKVIE
jgi:two-component system response regulator YesN